MEPHAGRSDEQFRRPNRQRHWHYGTDRMGEREWHPSWQPTGLEEDLHGWIEGESNRDRRDGFYHRYERLARFRWYQRPNKPNRLRLLQLWQREGRSWRCQVSAG